MRLSPFRKKQQGVAPRRLVETCVSCGLPFHSFDRQPCDNETMYRLIERSHCLTEQQIISYMTRAGWAMHRDGLTHRARWCMPWIAAFEPNSTAELVVAVARYVGRSPDDVLYDMLAQALLDGLEDGDD
jgi:hypothetical protein